MRNSATTSLLAIVRRCTRKTRPWNLIPLGALAFQVAAVASGATL
jgi:hypothetical protein